MHDRGIETSRAHTFAIGGFSEPISYDWHFHRRHQLICAFEGTLAVESRGRRHMIPSRRAALIPAGLAHRTCQGFAGPKRPDSRSRIASVFLSPVSIALPRSELVVFHSPSLLGEMIDRSLAWGPEHEPTQLSESFFQTIALLCVEWTQCPVPFWLPETDHPRIREALRVVATRISEADESMMAGICGMSERTFRRQFPLAMGMPWREYITRARLLRAAEELATPGAGVAETAWRVGYNSVAAFTNAFHNFTGQTPSQYRQRRIATEPEPACRPYERTKAR